jgi:translocation and assembly module TamB
MLSGRLKKYFKKLLKLVAWILGSFLLLFLFLTILLQFPSVQTRIINIITSQVSQKVDTRFEIERVAIRFPKSVGLKGIYAEDTNGDTLLYAGSIFVDIGLWGLLRNKVNVNSLELSNVTANMKREQPDSVFNYQFLIDAFADSDTLADEPELTEEETEKKPWKISAGQVSLKNIRYHLYDHFTGFELQASFSEFSTNLRDADLLNQKYHVRRLLLQGADVAINMFPRSQPSKPSDPDAEKPVLDIAANSLVLNDVRFNLSDADGMHMSIVADHLELAPENISLHQYLVELKTLKVERLDADFRVPADKTITADTHQQTNDTIQGDGGFTFDFAEVMDWTISLNDLSVRESSFKMMQGEQTMQDRRFNPGNINLQDIRFIASDILVAPERLTISISDIAAVFSDHFRIRKLAGDINIGTFTNIERLSLETEKSKIGLSFRSPDGLLKIDQNMIYDSSFELILHENHVNDDLAYFAPEMLEYYFNWPGNQGIKFGGLISGRFDDLVVDSLWVTGPDFFTTRIDGQIKGLPHTDSISVDMMDFRLFTAPRRFFANLPDSLSPSNMQLPEYVYLESKINGSLKDLIADANIRTNFGNISLSAVLKDSLNNAYPAFKGEILTESFHLGKLLMNEDMPEPLALSVDISGAGLKPDSMVAKVNTVIGNLVFKGNHFDDIIIDLDLDNAVVSVENKYQDEILSLDLNLDIGLFTEPIFVKGSLDIPYARLNELGIVENDMLLKTRIETDLVFDVDDFFNGTLDISDTDIASAGEIYNIPRLYIHSNSQPEYYSIDLFSDLVVASYKGNFSPVDIPGILSGFLLEYYDVPYLQAYIDTTGNKHFKVNLTVVPLELITQVLLPGIDSFDTLSLAATYNSESSELAMDLKMADFNYSGLAFREFSGNIVSNRQKLNFGIYLDDLIFNDIILHDFSAEGEMAGQGLDFHLGVKNQEREDLYIFSGLLQQQGDSAYRITINPDELLLNRDNWEIPADNHIVFRDKYLDIHNFSLQSNGRLLRASSRMGDEERTILELEMQNIDLGRMTDLAGDSLPLIGGLFNGELELHNMYDDPAIIADISVQHFSFEGDTIGDILLKAENTEPDLYTLMLTLNSPVTDVTASGTYGTGDRAGLNLDIDLKRLDLPTFELFAAGNISELKGYLSGNMQITGTTQNPVVAGEMVVNETSFRVTALNTTYTLRNERILFDRQQVQFQNFVILDAADRRATLGGNINFTELSQLVYNLNLTTQNFLLMDVPSGENELYHGRIMMDSDLRVRGSQESPVVDGRIKLNEGSSFTFTLPQSGPEAIGDEGVVEFVQLGDTAFFRMAMEDATPDELRSSFERMDISVNVEIDKETEVRIIIDEVAGDFLEIQGGGVLSYGVDPGGRVALSGRYDIVDGEYLLTFYDVIRRNFRIQSGSNIVWAGDPMNADVDITAIYSLRTSAAPLMAGQMEGGAQGGALRQQYPFMVHLKMKGKLQNPQISFEIELPPAHRNAMDGMLQGRITQLNQNDSELNKQVFALLIMGGFVQDNPFASAGGGGIASAARSSASQILSQQLNRISERYVRGVDINFEIESYEDFTSGDAMGRTELQLEVSRNFLDERLKVTVGGNMELENETHRQTELGDIAGDFSLEYLLTPEGNLRLKGFRTKNYADIFDGQVIETGVSLLFSRSYNQFRDLFTKKEEEVIVEPEDSMEENDIE